MGIFDVIILIFCPHKVLVNLTLKKLKMKKLFTLLALTIFVTLINCGGKKRATNAEEYSTPVESTPKAVDVPADDIAQGKALVDANDCKVCHTATSKIIGPAHLDVAKRYAFTEENVSLLASKIMNGGSGVWGDVPMAAHKDLSEEDAKKMARYVLSLDGEVEK